VANDLQSDGALMGSASRSTDRENLARAFHVERPEPASGGEHAREYARAARSRGSQPLPRPSRVTLSRLLRERTAQSRPHQHRGLDTRRKAPPPTPPAARRHKWRDLEPQAGTGRGRHRSTHGPHATRLAAKAPSPWRNSAHAAPRCQRGLAHGTGPRKATPSIVPAEDARSRRRGAPRTPPNASPRTQRGSAAFCLLAGNSKARASGRARTREPVRGVQQLRALHTSAARKVPRYWTGFRSRYAARQRAMARAEREMGSSKRETSTSARPEPSPAAASSAGSTSRPSMAKSVPPGAR
jgi:hypothetical protein